MPGKTFLNRNTEQTRSLSPGQYFYKLLLLGLLLLTLNSSFAQSRSFVKKFHPLADSLSEVYGIPAAVLLGISIIESSSGTSRNCKLLNNYFGIIGKNKIKKVKKSRYKQYPDATASFAGFCRLVSKRKFYKKLKGNMNYKLWIDAISKSNYSEVPAVWKQRVLAAIHKNKLSASH
jgi:flagellum-specific peptidoglycan hydrolase FlgJ